MLGCIYTGWAINAAGWTHLQRKGTAKKEGMVEEQDA